MLIERERGGRDGGVRECREIIPRKHISVLAVEMAIIETVIVN